MGFWGTYIVARADQPLPGLPALRQAAESVSWHGRGPGGWQAVQVHRGPEGWSSAALPAPWEATLTALMEQAGHPVLAAVVLDSDGAQLIGYSPVAGRWGGWLMLDSIIGHIIPDAWPLILSWDEDSGMPQQFEADEDYQRRCQPALDRLHAVGPPAPGAAPLAVTWASEAGLQPDPVAVEAALEARDVFCEDVFFGLLAALGVPELTSDITTA
jgi:hypothetical protein